MAGLLRWAAGIADVRKVVDGWPADIHRDVIGVRRRKTALSFASWC